MPFAVALGQPSDHSPGYKLATVTPNTENSARSAVVNIPPGPLIISGVTLKELIMYASGAPGFEVAGGRQWVSTARWNFRVEPETVLMRTEQYQHVLWRVP